MATVPKETRKLTFIEIVMNAEADVIKAAYEARVEVDKLLAQRDEAYRRIAELETGVETLVGEPGLFVFPPPPLPVAGMEVAVPRPRRPAKATGTAASQPGAPGTPKGTDGGARSASAAAVPASDAEKPAAARPESPERPASRGGTPARPH